MARFSNQIEAYDATVIGVPFDGGCTYRSGTRFGPQGIRRISALYTPYNYEMGVDLREEMSLCDAGDVFTIPANLEKSFDQVRNCYSLPFSLTIAGTIVSSYLEYDYILFFSYLPLDFKCSCPCCSKWKFPYYSRW